MYTHVLIDINESYISIYNDLKIYEHAGWDDILQKEKEKGVSFSSP